MIVPDRTLQATREYLDLLDRDIAESRDPVRIRQLRCLRGSIEGDLKRWIEARRKESENAAHQSHS